VGRASLVRALRALCPALGALTLIACVSGARRTTAAVPQAGEPAPPVAARRAYAVPSPNGSREDPYYWLRDDTRKSQEVLDYLRAENAYTDAMLKGAQPLADRINAEIVGRIKQDDSTVPYRKRGYWYYRRFVAGGEYPIIARKRGTLEAPEQVMLDVPEMAKGHDFFQVGQFEASRDSELVAWTEDTVGRRQYTLRVKDLRTGKVLPDAVKNIEESVVWAADNRTLLYLEKDPVTLLGYQVRKHVLGTDPTMDPLVYEQPDKTFYTRIDSTKDDAYLMIESESTLSTEVQYARADDPKLEFKIFLPREPNHEYQVDHLSERWIVRTNWQAKNFRIVEVPDGKTAAREAWRDVVPHRADAFIETLELFRDMMAVQERSGGQRRVRIRSWHGGKDSLISADEADCAIALWENPEADTKLVRYTYDSLSTPRTIYDYDVKTGKNTLLKRDAVQGDFDPAHYLTELRFAPARDGVKIPVSIVYRKGTPRDGSAPLVQTGYGSYGFSTDPQFSIPVLSLLDRGVVYAIAHIRGGQEMGRDWYDDGRMMHKRNTFTDFIDATRFLVKERYADGRRVFASGRSAGGLLMGAIANLAPDDYRGIVAIVPFVDIVTTMLDESVPLTTTEFDQWGNPKEKAAYEYILSYSPYDNVGPHAYPALYVGTGLWDSQVQYYEPTKWVAKLRALKRDHNLLVLRTNMEAGHGGKSGRFQRYREIAEQWAFILTEAGVKQ
jgi:oligopeptidase B